MVTDAAASSWFPIVWGRTRRADSWWRVLPAGLDFDGWPAEVVTAAYAGGLNLERPRFLLARLHGWWVTGVACAAVELDPSMAEDQHGRDLFTVVGWMAKIATEPALPQLQDWEDRYLAWAAPTYTDWCREDWDKHFSSVSDPHESPLVSPAWADAPEASEQVDARLVRRPGRVQMFPATTRFELWRAGSNAIEPFVLVTGWAEQQAVDFRWVTHVAIAGLDQPNEVDAADGGPELGDAEPPDPIVDDEPSATATPNSESAEQPRRTGLWSWWTALASQRRVETLEHAVAALQADIGELREQFDRLTSGSIDRSRAAVLHQMDADEPPDETAER